MAPKKKAEPKPTMCNVCGERPATHQGGDKQHLCDTCDPRTASGYQRVASATTGAKKPAFDKDAPVGTETQDGNVTWKKATEQPGRKIIAMQVENIKCIKLVRFRPQGSMVIFSGKNGSGKTSMLDAYDFAVRGTTKIPSQPIRKGANTATIQIDFGDFKVERTFTRIEGGKEPYLTKLNVYGRNKERYPTPQTLLDAWNNATTFDPLAFARMEPKKQLETLRRMVKFDVDLDEIEAQKKIAYDTRRDAGRDVEAATARLARYAEPAADLPEEPIDTAALTKQLEDAANHNNLIAAQEQAKQRKVEEAEATDQRAYDIAAEIEELQKKIIALKADHTQALYDANRLRKEAEKMPVGERTDAGAVAEQLRTAGVLNEAIRHRNAYRAAKKEVEEAEKLWTVQDLAVKVSEKERIEAMERAQFPIEQLGFTDAEVTYKGLPFAQASHAEQIRVSVSLGIAWNPELRVMLIRDGDLLDDDTLNLVEGMVKDSHHQLLIERMNAGARPCITMEDGEASGAEVEKVPAR